MAIQEISTESKVEVAKKLGFSREQLQNADSEVLNAFLSAVIQAQLDLRYPNGEQVDGNDLEVLENWSNRF